MEMQIQVTDVCRATVAHRTPIEGRGIPKLDPFHQGSWGVDRKVRSTQHKSGVGGQRMEVSPVIGVVMGDEHRIEQRRVQVLLKPCEGAGAGVHEQVRRT